MLSVSAAIVWLDYLASCAPRARILSRRLADVVHREHYAKVPPTPAAIRERCAADHEAERDEWKGKFEGEVTKGKKAKINADLTDVLSASGITNPAFVKADRAILRRVSALLHPWAEGRLPAPGSAVRCPGQSTS